MKILLKSFLFSLAISFLPLNTTKAEAQSSISTAITIRLSNDLIDRIKDWAIANNCINNTGRSDKRGEPNLSQALTELVNTGLDSIVSDTVPQDSYKDFVTRAELDRHLGS